MNMKKGLQRLWLACSFLWAIFSIITFQQSLTASVYKEDLAKDNSTFNYVRTTQNKMIPLLKDVLKIHVPSNSFLLFGQATPKEEVEETTKNFYEKCTDDTNGVWTDNIFIFLDYYPNIDLDKFNQLSSCNNLKKIGIAYGDHLVPNWRERAKIALIIITPPIFIYLFGLLGLWVIRGFRS